MSLYQVGLSQDVVVDEENKLTLRCTNSHIPGCGCAAFDLQKRAEIGVRAALLVEHRLSVIGRFIIDDQDLVQFSPYGLMFDLIDCAGQQVGTIPCRHNDTNFEHMSSLRKDYC